MRSRSDEAQDAADRGGASIDLARLYAAVGDLPYEWRIDSDTLVWGDNASAILRLSDRESIATGRGFAQLLDPENAETRFDAVMGATLRDGGAGVPYLLQYALRPLTDAGEKVWLEDVGRWYAGPDGRPHFAHGVVRVITARREREQRLAFLSQFDDLTGEINQYHLTESLAATIDDAVRYRASCGYVVVAINDLARLNEAYGFEVADEVVAAVAKRLRAKLRGGDILGRFSGNKFGVVFKSCTPEDLAVAAERLLQGVRDDVVQTSAGPIAATVTIGGVNAPRYARTVSEAMARALEALAKAKARRRGSFHAYAPNVERDAIRRENMRAGDEIVAALNERRVVIGFEPVVRTDTRQPAFYECLLRIRRTDGAIIPAGDVVSAAERLGLVRLIDQRMLELVVEELAAARELVASVNVSPASTNDPDWWDSLSARLRRDEGVARRLIIEITETAAIQNIDDTRGFVLRAKDLGCLIAIDDFGAGYTSFRNLRKLGVDLIKIDGAFVRNLTRSQDDRAFVRTLIELAQRLGLKTVAEWVQDDESAALLSDWGCDYIQGALVGGARLDRPHISALGPRATRPLRSTTL